MAHERRGQGLLEATIAIGILVVGILSVLAVAGRQLAVLRIAEERFIAGELVREGLEVAHSMRDSNWLKGAAWNAGLGDGQGIFTLADTVSVDGSRWNLVTLPASAQFGDAASYVYNDRGVYRQAVTPGNGWERTTFQRLITFAAVSSQAAVRVIVEVRWGNARVPPRVIAETVLYDWK